MLLIEQKVSERNLRPCDFADLVAQYSYCAIAKEFGVSDKSVRKYAVRLGCAKEMQHIRARHRPSKFLLQEMLDNGLSVNEIAGKYHVHRHTVAEWRRIYGIPGNDKTSKRPPAAVLDHILSQSNLREAAELFGVNHTTILRWHKKDHKEIA